MRGANAKLTAVWSPLTETLTISLTRGRVTAMNATSDQLFPPIDWPTVMREQYPLACRVIKRLMSPRLRANL